MGPRAAVASVVLLAAAALAAIGVSALFLTHAGAPWLVQWAFVAVSVGVALHPRRRCRWRGRRRDR